MMHNAHVTIQLPSAVTVTDAIPLPEHFAHPSTLHGQRHVGRVMVHAMRLVDVLHYGNATRAMLWASVYVHDLRRTHDYECHVHGRDAAKHMLTDAALHAMVMTVFAANGLPARDVLPVRTAVTFHALPNELPPAHPAWTLTALLKDADALDRVRIGDLDPKYLRFRETHNMVDFAWRLLEISEGVPEGPDHFEILMARSAALT
jgi:hypothetical protein